MRDLVGMGGCGDCGMEMNKKSGGVDVRASKSPSEMAYRGQLHASEAKPEAQLGARRSQSHEPREGRSWQIPTKSLIHPPG